MISSLVYEVQLTLLLILWILYKIWRFYRWVPRRSYWSFKQGWGVYKESSNTVLGTRLSYREAKRICAVENGIINSRKKINKQEH